MSPTEQEVNSPSSRTFDTPTLLFLLAALIFLYPSLFVFPFIPIDHHGDGTIYLSDGMRIYEGEVMYRDFFQFSTPGTALSYFLLFKVFGPRLWIPDLALLLLGLGLAWLGVVIAKKVMRPSLALLPSAIFLVGVYQNQLDATHHWYSLLTATAALASLMERRTPARIAAAGFFCALTACFTQSRGLAAVMGFGAFLWWESRRRQEDWRELLKKEAWLVGSFLATIMGVNAYFVWKAGLTRFLWCTVVFGIKYYPKQADANTWLVFTLNLPEFEWLSNFRLHFMRWLFLYAVIPSTYILFFARYRRECGKGPMEFWERPMLLAVVGTFMLLGVAPAPSFPRMATSALPGFILLGWFTDPQRKLGRSLAGVLTVGILLVVPYGVARSQSIKVSIFATPQGKLAEREGDQGAYEEYTWVQHHTRPSEYLYEPGDADMYFSLSLRNPTPLPFVTNNGYTTPEQVMDVIRGLQQHPVHYIVWSHQWLEVIPDWEEPSDDHLGPLRDYIQRHYHVVKVFTNSDKIWERND